MTDILIHIKISGLFIMRIDTVLDQIDLGNIALPEFQRGYVWNRNQVRSLMQSLYRRFPVGSLLVWLTPTDEAIYRGESELSPGVVKLLLDGQQRITSLYGIIRGKPPAFFEGNSQAFLNLYFNVEEEVFEFYMPTKMKDNPLWVSVTEVMQNGIADFVNRYNIPELKDKLGTYIQRINNISSIKSIDLYVEEITGADKTIDVVVDIFNRVNTGGTKLSKGDLALAKICTAWPDARKTMKNYLDKWEERGFSFTLEWLLRNVTTTITGEAMFDALKDVSATDFKNGLEVVHKNCDYLLNMISGRLGLDHDRVLGGRYAFPVMTRYLALKGGKISNAKERDQLLYWYVNSFLWGRFAGSTESILNVDLKALEPLNGALDRLIANLKQTRGNLVVRPEDFSGWSIGSRFYPMIYMLVRVYNAIDWGSGVPLSANMLGKFNSLQMHHIFPRALLYKHGYNKAQVNAIANYCFLTQATNLNISDKSPEVYLAEIESNYPGALSSQWVPTNPDLWKLENYTDFLSERRKLLANAANLFLNDLLNGTATAPGIGISFNGASLAPVSVSVADDEVNSLLKWINDKNLPKPQVDYEVCDADGNVLTVVDLAWPDGVQMDYSEPVALVLEPDEQQMDILSRAGYKVFSKQDTIKSYLLEMQ
jgi:hypothetical protein